MVVFWAFEKRGVLACERLRRAKPEPHSNAGVRGHAAVDALAKVAFLGSRISAFAPVTDHGLHGGASAGGHATAYSEVRRAEIPLDAMYVFES